MTAPTIHHGVEPNLSVDQLSVDQLSDDQLAFLYLSAAPSPAAAASEPSAPKAAESHRSGAVDVSLATPAHHHPVVTSSHASHREQHERRHRSVIFMRTAWVGVLAIPFAFAAGMLVGEAILSWLGYSFASDAQPALGAATLAAMAALLIALAPPVTAVWAGLRARVFGARMAMVPITIGAVVIVYWIAISTQGLLAILLAD